MKVVLFCGGFGTRLREHSDTVPKPMVGIGFRPMIWHLMKYYAHFGHTEFILCLGYRGDLIKQYFIDYQEWLSNDFQLSGKDRGVANALKRRCRSVLLLKRILLPSAVRVAKRLQSH